MTATPSLDVSSPTAVLTPALEDLHALIVAKAPANAQAAIVAELDENDSDPMTDYFAHKTTRRVVIGWRTGKREDFRQLRRAAASFPETAHLGPGLGLFDVEATYTEDSVYQGQRVRLCDNLDGQTFRTEAEAREAIAKHNKPDGGECSGVAWSWKVREGEDLEHRDNYSMGGGNYLKAGGPHSSGWRVVSVPFDREAGTIGYGGHGEFEDGLPVAGDTPDNPDATQPIPEPIAGDGYAVETYYHTRREIDFHIVVPSDRLDRDRFEALRSSCRRAGGWYSRKWGTTPGGFAFEDHAAAAAWAGEQFSA